MTRYLKSGLLSATCGWLCLLMMRACWVQASPPSRPVSAKYYPHRWVYVPLNLRSDGDVDEIRNIAQVAFAHGLNGMVLTGSLDALEWQDQDYFRRLDEVRQIAVDNSLEIIPELFSAGYAGAVYTKNRNLAEGFPVKDALFAVSGGIARFRQDPAVLISNGDFEHFAGNQFSGYYQDYPGTVSFVDTAVRNSGQASIRFENFRANPTGNGRIILKNINVHPWRCYRASIWVKTEALDPVKSFNFFALGQDGSQLCYMSPQISATGDWRRTTIGFNSGNNTTVNIYAGIWGGRGGRFWLDDLIVEEVGLINVLRRPGTPLSVRSDSTGAVYEEGRDYAPIADANLNFRFDHDGPSIAILPGSRIRDGEQLRVSYYHGTNIYDGQVSLCMSEPQLYEIWADEARRVQEVLRPARWMLSMDEIRMGGTCEACKRRNMSMAQILGDCITRQVGIIRTLNPAAEVLTWSDMLDPNHNARPNYYLVDGDYTGSWLYVPSDLGIVCWYTEKRYLSLRHFSSQGFRTFGSVNCDGVRLDATVQWLEALDQTPAAAGIMYTTWQNDYSLLLPFADLVANHWRAPAPLRPAPSLPGWSR